VVEEMPFIADVFISYSQKDSKIVSIVVKDLEEAGLKIWQDKTRIAPGERIREKVNDGIRNSSVVLIFISLRSLRSRSVLDELDMAMYREKQERRTVVYPILIGRVSKDSKKFPEDLKGKAYIDLRFRFDSKYRAFRDQLIAVIRAASNPRFEETGRTISMGEPFIKFLVNYQFVGKNEKFRISENVLNIFADTWTKGLDMWDDQDREEKKRRREFLRNYGHYTLRKLFIFALETAGTRLTHFFNEKDIVEVLGTMNSFILVLDTQQKVVGPMGDQIQMQIMENGEVLKVYRLITFEKQFVVYF
jgi:hypothetical protein